jgi:pseudaminic acid synthase
MTRFPLIVGEISGNHNGSLSRALQIVDLVADAGAGAVKLQTYTPDTLTLDVDDEKFRVTSDHLLWPTRTLYDLYQEAHTPWEWHAEIFNYARSLGLVVFSTPFDETAVDFLETLDCPIYKIASLEIVDLPLIRKAARTGKPLIISTGAATFDEVTAAVAASREAGCVDLTLLVCTSSYPANPDDAHLRRMQTLSDTFGVKVGLSDHTRGIGVSVAATALGATVIEKHVTLDHEDGGVDSAFSLDASELALLVRECDVAARSLGQSDFWQSPSEGESLRFRPSLYICQDVEAGELVSDENVRSVRPSGGLSPDMIEIVRGRSFTQAARMGTPLSMDLLNPQG